MTYIVFGGTLSLTQSVNSSDTIEHELMVHFFLCSHCVMKMTIVSAFCYYNVCVLVLAVSEHYASCAQNVAAILCV